MNVDFYVQSKEVFSYLEDEISKRIFLARMTYAVTGDLNAIFGLEPKYRNLSSDIEMFAEKVCVSDKNYVYGAGGFGRSFINAFKILKYEAFIDEYRKEQIDSDTGLRIINIDSFVNELSGNFSNVKVFVAISNSRDADEVCKILVDRVGISSDRVVKCVPDWRNNSSQYFDLFQPRDNEVFVDCGCFDGSTCFRFAGWCSFRKFDKIYSFEPDRASFEKCKKIIEPISGCEVFPYGTSRTGGNVYFLSNGREDARIISEEKASELKYEAVEVIKTVCLDEFLAGKRVTFIKMDIEGAEMDSLLGAENIIRSQKPRLAISVYHKIDDILRIPLWLKSINPDYKFYLRHYSLLPNETILYAE